MLTSKITDMNKNILLLLLSIICITQISCEDFLDESSQDEIRPSTTEDLRQLLLGEGYQLDAFCLPYLDLLTDDVSCYGDQNNEQLTGLLQKAKAAFTWQPDMYFQIAKEGALNCNSWKFYYSKIKGCNVVLDQLENVEGSEENKSDLKGQALALRSYYYFMLVNLYGQPYNNENIDISKSLGVPLILSSEVEDKFPVRNTIKEVYDQILTDLSIATPLLEKYTVEKSVHKVSALFAYMLYSRIYMIMEDWDSVLKYSNLIIDKKSTLMNLSELYQYDQTVDWKDQYKNSVYSIAMSDEIIWAYSRAGEQEVFYTTPPMGYKPVYGASHELMNLYESGDGWFTQGDLRKKYYYEGFLIGFTPDWQIIMGYKCGNKSYRQNSASPNKGMRVAEAYLNRAEANIRLSIKNGTEDNLLKALQDLNHLRSYRYDTSSSPYTNVEITNAEELLKFCKEERRRELAYEDIRWFDLRRYGMPEIKHTLIINNEEEEYILMERDNRYVLPIPEEIIERNTSLVQNPS